MRRFGVIALLLLLTACKGEDLVPTAPPAAPAPEPAPDAEAPKVLAQGTFMGANGYTTVGTVTLEEVDGVQVLRFSEDFATDRSIALDVRLCQRQRCGAQSLVLGGIQSFSGAQSYPVDGDGTGRNFAVIWCAAVDLPFGTARLE